ncbi:chemotaxis protein CheA [Novosphingobium rosa]|uniref:chemotaxis protein CheA n=1 Tax=Novosphingobium rosa TaxID=76978 RepID=UPI000831ACD9|nr:chemotaxis protein CheA [Novosphingobium rosa]
MTPEDIQAIFFVECEEAQSAAEAGLAACRAGTQDADTIHAVFRAIHSIKGGAGAFGFAALQTFAHGFETLLSEVREGNAPLNPPLVDLLLRALDKLADHVTAAREGAASPQDSALLMELEAAARYDAAGRFDAPVAKPKAKKATPKAAAPSPTDSARDDSALDALLAELSAPSPAPGDQPREQGWQIWLRPLAGAMRNGGEPLLLLRELSELGAVCLQCDTSAVPGLDDLDPDQAYLGWTFVVPKSVSEASVREIFDFAGDDCPITIGEGDTKWADMPYRPAALSPPPPPPAAEAPGEAPQIDTVPAKTPAAPPVGQSIRIDLLKLDKLIDTVGELVIAQAMLAQRLHNDGVAANEEFNMLEGLTRDIQDSAMSIRAQPIGSVFSRVPRILRELAASTGKHVTLKTSGEATELDKTVIERLGEPLTHLIRNAVDHGIEKPDERLARGKSADGTLTLSAEHRSGHILIRIADDGAGIDHTRVLAKAVEKGIVAADAALTKEEIESLIFAPGFSTAASITNVSGRGVGMDVVRQNVKELGGRITIDSTLGKGTTFTLTLPLTLAISDGMIVKVGDQTLVVPLAHVVESLRPAPADVQGMGVESMMLNVRGRFIPVVSVAHAVGALGAVERPEQGVLIVVETESAGQAALLVDNIWDQRQFVIKSLDTHYRSVEGVAGATILGDGRVALILNVDTLVARAAGPRLTLEPIGLEAA